jgi:RNA-binding protein 8A
VGYGKKREEADDKGYALIEFAKKEEAEAAIKGTNGTKFLEERITTCVAGSPT